MINSIRQVITDSWITNQFRQTKEQGLNER